MSAYAVVAAIVLYAASGVVGLALGDRHRAAERLAAALVCLASAVALAAAFGLFGIGDTELRAPWSVPGGELHLGLDGISAMFVAQIAFVTPLCAIYGLEYWTGADHPKNAAKLRVFFGLLAGSLILVVTARNAILFLCAWEVMALSAFFLVTTEDHDAKVRDTGLLYLVATRLGTLCLFAMFVLLHRATGTWDFHAARAVPSTPIFLLALAGFGLKAGAMPFHVWLPAAHATAPSHVSALMSGVLIKAGIYGLVRTCTLFLDPPAWWGGALLGAGVLSGVLGVAFALGQHDLKRLLAYHSVENIGIILIGLGVAMLGRALGRSDLVLLGLAGALLHTWNHGLFKALLFLCAGAVVHATGTREIDHLGGLSKRMPWTALGFLLGAVAICGLPPLNGFASELLVYLGLLGAAPAGGGELWPLAACFAAPALALVGGLAIACFVKVHGAVFLGEPRSEAARRGHDPGAAMLVPIAVLASACVLIGAAPSTVVPVLERAASSFTRSPAPALDAPFAWVTALSLALIGLIAAGALWHERRSRLAPRAATWGCGYTAPTARMQYTASSFAGGLVSMFAWALRPKVHAPAIAGPFPATPRFGSHVPDLVLDGAIMPVLRAAAWLLASLRILQRGSVHAYLLYIVAAVILFLVFR